MITFSELKDNYSLTPTLSGCGDCFAHTRANGDKELLSEHTNLVLESSLQLITEYGLEPVIDNLIFRTIQEKTGVCDEKSENFLKSLFLNSIRFHDYGKINVSFQALKMLNPVYKNKKDELGTSHSLLSSYLFIAHELSELKRSDFQREQNALLVYFIFLFSYIISRHHGRLDRATDEPFGISLSDMAAYIHSLKNSGIITLEQIHSIINRRAVTAQMFFGDKKGHSNIFHLLRLNYSLLTAADYLATNQFTLDMPAHPVEVIDGKLRDKILKGLYSISYNQETLTRMEKGELINPEHITGIGLDNLNLLRQALAAEVIYNIRNAKKDKLFYIEAPTGSGKTNLSLLAAAELLNQSPGIKRIFYVFPFITLITQTNDYLSNKLKLSRTEAAEIHSKASYHSANETDDEAKSRLYNYIDSLFINYPVTLMTHVKFFNILVSNSKSDTYLLHKLANSIVIIDEIQSYNPEMWDKINYLLQEYSELYNIRFIIMSATLPKIGKLLSGIQGVSSDKFTYLVNNRSAYFDNPNFKHRVSFRFDYVGSPYSEESLAGWIQSASQEYLDRTGGVKVLTEFVTKTTAQKFFEYVSRDPAFDAYEKLILNGNILEPRRKELMHRLKTEGSFGQNLILITTQVIEAGADIDMDLGFKDMSIIDSEEQFAGRINRNASKAGCSVFLFNTGDAAKIYKNDLRYKVKIPVSDYEIILNQKDLDAYYDQVFQIINHDNNNPLLAGSLPHFISLIDNFSFKDVSCEFQLIKGETLPVFVPLDINSIHFTDEELRFLTPLLSGDPVDNGSVSGYDIWEIYERLIANNDLDVFMKKADLNLLAPVISRFCFNIYRNQGYANSLKNFGEEKYGFFYLYNYQQIYSYETGLKADIETDCSFI